MCYCVKFIMCQIIKYEISICSDLCLPYVHGSLRNVSIPPTFTNTPNSIKGKSKLINFKLYNLKVYTFFVATYCFVPSFRKAKSCGVPSRAIVKVGCAVGKKRSRDTGLRNQNNLYFGILGWIYINTFNVYPSPPLNEKS
jgi:hypothetical protein